MNSYSWRDAWQVNNAYEADSKKKAFDAENVKRVIFQDNTETYVRVKLHRILSPTLMRTLVGIVILDFNFRRHVPHNVFTTLFGFEFATKADGSSFSTGSKQLATASRVEIVGATRGAARASRSPINQPALLW